MNYRLGLDVGTNSLGWAVLKMEKGEPCAILAAGSRIFSDGRNPQSLATLATGRRAARSARRRRDRYKQRRTHLLNALTEAGLFPEDKNARQALQKLNPLKLRQRLLTESAKNIKASEDIGTVNVKPEHLIGRALFHLNQRRGFQSNRKTDRANEDTTKIDEAITKTRGKQKDKGSPTIGAYLWSLNKKHEPTLARPRNKKGEHIDGSASVDHYDLYVGRDMLKDEFDQIWHTCSKEFSALMTSELKKKIRDCIIFYQRDLKVQDVGMCQYMHNKKRAAKALPSIQQHRIYQDLNNLKWFVGSGEVRLRDHDEAYAKIEKMLLRPTAKSGQVTFDAMRKALKGINAMADVEGLTAKENKSHPKFNLEKGKGKKSSRKKGTQEQASNDRKHLNGDKTSALFGGKDSPVAEQWKDWSNEKRDAFVLTIIGRVPNEKCEGQERYKREEEAIADLVKNHCLTAEDADSCVEYERKLDQGYADLSAEAANRIIERMKSDGKPTQREAVQQEAASCSDGSFKDPYDVVGDGDKEELIYYGAVERLAPHIIPGSRKEEDKWDDRKYHGGVSNPTVHIALNQMRQVVNDIIAEYGKPKEISIELGRNLPVGPQKRMDKRKKQNARREANERDKKELRAAPFGIPKPSKDDIKKLRLWKESKHTCPYCPKKIGCAELFKPEGQIQIEHIIPQAMGGQDNWSNLTVAHSECNLKKGDCTAYEAFGDDMDYSVLPEYKHWRFDKDARKIWQKVFGGFLNRHLNDTRYIGVIAKKYLGDICADKNITVTTGELTHNLRKYWNLDSILDNPSRPEEDRGTKNRNDHRHHAVDAIVVGMVGRSLVQKVSTIRERNQFLSVEKLMEHLVGQSKENREQFLKKVKAVVDNIFVSHKPSRKKPIYMVDKTTVTSNRSKAKLDKKGRPIKISTDGQLHDATARGGPLFRKGGEEAKAKDFEQPVNVTHKKKLTVIPIHDKDGKIYKGYEPNDNWAMEIYKYPDKYPTNPKPNVSDWKKKCGKWEGQIIRRFDANQPEFDPDDIKGRLPCPGASFIMRLQEDDLIEIDTEQGRQIMVVHRMTGTGFDLAPHNEANVAGRNNNKYVNGLYKGYEFVGELRGRQNAKIIAVEASKKVTGSYQGERFSGEIKRPKGEKVEKVVFNHRGNEKTLDLNAQGLDWKYDDKENFSDDAWKCVKNEFQISADAPCLEWSFEDKFSFTFKTPGKLQKLNARKVHISPTGQVNYETRYETQRRKRRKKK